MSSVSHKGGDLLIEKFRFHVSQILCFSRGVDQAESTVGINGFPWEMVEFTIPTSLPIKINHSWIPVNIFKKNLMGKSIHVRSVFLFFFGLLFQLKRIHLLTSYLANLAGIPHLSPFDTFSGLNFGMDKVAIFIGPTPFPVVGWICHLLADRHVVENWVLESRWFLGRQTNAFFCGCWKVEKPRCWSGLVWVQDASYFFSLLLMCLDIYISYTVSVIYILYKITYSLCICMNYLSNCWFALIYSTCWWVWSYSTWSWVFMMCVNLSTSWWVLIDFWP